MWSLLHKYKARSATWNMSAFIYPSCYWKITWKCWLAKQSPIRLKTGALTRLKCTSSTTFNNSSTSLRNITSFGLFPTGHIRKRSLNTWKSILVSRNHYICSINKKTYRINHYRLFIKELANAVSKLSIISIRIKAPKWRKGGEVYSLIQWKVFWFVQRH